jgi:hypothetical protein
MPEILTESFCERCGTRYTFESTAPKPRMGRFKTLSKGLKNFVLDDDTSLDEALAAARNEESREATSEQLDAFHKTFNFCMSCRQYTCANCWNDAEGQCLTCSPVAGRGLSAAWGRSEDSSPAWPAQTTERPGIEAVAWPVADRRRPEPEPAPVEEPWPLAALEGRVPPAEEPVGEQEATADAEAEPIAEPEVFAEAASEEWPTADGSAPPALPGRAAAASSGGGILGRFRPGQSLDEALAAYEASLESAESGPAWAQAEPEPEPEPVWAEAEPAPEPEPEPVWAEPEPAEPQPVWAEAAPEQEPASPEPLDGGWPERDQIPWPEPTLEPEPEPVAWAESEPEPAAPPQPPAPRPAEDIVQVPTWHVVAPENAPVNGYPTDALRPAAGANRPEPQWPGQSAESFLAARLAARKAGDDMWAASSVEVLGPAPAGGPGVPVGVQPCVSCGLSLSATAHFCRRCGTRQG